MYEKKPVRKDLYNPARMVMWLPQYQDSGLDEIVADLKDIFSRWPWYDEQETEYVAGDDVGDQFQKRHFDDRLGWHETTVPRRTVRDELITQLTRSPSTPAERLSERAASEPDTFVVKPVRELRTR